MVDEIRHFDICILCAKAEEAEAVINEFSDRLSVQFVQGFSKVNGFEYHYTTINYKERDPLTVLVIWMAFAGPTQTINGVRSLLEEFRPRFAAMTGICAGYKKKVALGDLIAVPYAFYFEEGKIETDKDGQDRLRPEWKSHRTAERIVQYINKFSSWKTPIAEMKQHRIGRELLEAELPKCLIVPIASSMAVQGNDPFPKLLEHNRNALFLDQEVAAFYETLSNFPDIYFLAVKGVCDYGDKNKKDDYHEYAARASAVYLLYFIQEYVTETTMPTSRGRRSIKRKDSHRARNVSTSSINIEADPHQTEINRPADIGDSPTSTPKALLPQSETNTMAMPYVLDLKEALQRRTLVLFIGNDLSCAVTGLPSRTDLAHGLAHRYGINESLSLAEVAQRVSQSGNRHAFTAFLRDALDTVGKSPKTFHERITALVQKHQIEMLITTTYDYLLEFAFQQATKGYNHVTSGSDVAFVQTNLPTLIKLYGDIRQPNTLIITDRDHFDLVRNQDKEAILDEVRRAFRRSTVLFLGYNLSDPDFRFLFDQIAQGRFAKTAYAVWPGLSDSDMRMWRDRGIVIIDTDPLEVLEMIG